MKIYKSRFTPNVSAEDIDLKKGEKVKYQLLDGNVIDAIIVSGVMSHVRCPDLGYEAITLDDNQKHFINGKRIVWWEGKTNSMNELDSVISKAKAEAIN